MINFIIYFTLITSTGLTTNTGAPQPHATRVSSMQACNDYAEILKKKMGVPAGFTIVHQCKEMT